MMDAQTYFKNVLCDVSNNSDFFKKEQTGCSLEQVLSLKMGALEKTIDLFL